MTDQKALWPGWETVRLIGRGSFGAVYEIRRDMLGDLEKAALKVITIPQNDSDIEELYSEGYDKESLTNTFKNHLKSIISEYSLMRKMNGSANIVNCDDVRYVQHDDGIGWDIYIKMELLTPLAKSLPAQITENTVIRIAKDLCHALVLCKRHDIVHRDIKPQNIFVSDNGDYKLGDFGIAKTVEKTSGGTKIGTYKYMAPEVYNNQPYGAGADIYSLGLVLYWLLNNRRMPFMPLPPEPLRAGMDEQARMRRLSGEPLPVPVNGSDALKAIVLKACAYDPKDRYASAAAMMDALNRLELYNRMSLTPQVQPLQQPVQSQPTAESDEMTIGIWGRTVSETKVPDSQPSPAPLSDPDVTVDIFQAVVPAPPAFKVDVETERTYKRAKNIMDTGNSKETSPLLKPTGNAEDLSGQYADSHDNATLSVLNTAHTQQSRGAELPFTMDSKTSTNPLPSTAYNTFSLSHSADTHEKSLKPDHIYEQSPEHPLDTSPSASNELPQRQPICEVIPKHMPSYVLRRLAWLAILVFALVRLPQPHVTMYVSSVLGTSSRSVFYKYDFKPDIDYVVAGQPSSIVRNVSKPFTEEDDDATD